MLIISDILWNEIKQILPEKISKVGRPPHDPIMVLSGIWYIMITCAQWHKLPDYYGKPTTIHGRFRNLIKAGIFETLLQKSAEKTRPIELRMVLKRAFL